MQKGFLKIKLIGTHNKPRGVRGLSNSYHMCFYSKLVHVAYAIRCIPCTLIFFTYSIDQPCITGLPAHQKLRYQLIKDCAYWPVLDSFNNCYILKLSHKETSSEEIDKVHQVVLDVISENMATLLQKGQYVAINTTDTSTMIYYVVKFMSEPYTLHEEKM